MESQPKPIRKFKKRYILYAALALFIVGVIVTPSKKTTGKAKMIETEKEPPKPAFEITAPELANEYEENEVSADMKYKSKIIAVTGIVTDIKKDFTNDIYVVLSDGKEFSLSSVNCSFNDEQIAAQLKKGMRVTLQGECDGLMIGIVVMKNCVLK